MSSRRSRKNVTYIPAAAKPNRKVVHVLRSGENILFFTNKNHKPRAGLCVSDLLQGKAGDNRSCTFMISVFRGESTRPFDGGYLHIKGDKVILEGLHDVYHKTPKLREFEYFEVKYFRENDRIEFDKGKCLDECVAQFRRNELRAIQAAA